MTDFFGIVGAGLIVGGVSWIHPPSGMIAGGAFLLTGAILAARKPETKGVE